MDMNALIMSMGYCPAQRLKSPFEWLWTKGYNTRIKCHTAAFSILNALGVDADWSSDNPTFVTTLLGDLNQEHLYKKFGFSRSMGTVKELKELIINGKSEPLLLHFLAQYFGVSVITISQYNRVCFYSANLGGAVRYHDVLILKEMDKPGHYTACVNDKDQILHKFSELENLVTQSQSTFEKLPVLLDASQFVTTRCDDDDDNDEIISERMLLKMKWSQLNTLAESHGIKSYEKKKSGTGEKKRTKASIVQDLLDIGISKKDVSL